MPRPYMEATIAELERLVSENRTSRTILAEIREELRFRKRERARQLLREVEGLLEGQVPMPPKPPKPDDPEDQLSLIK